MKKSLFALAALTAFAGAAQAQSSVEIYGLLDVGVGTINNVHSGGSSVTSATTGSWTGMTTGNEATSRLGFRGKEDLGGGLKANFTLEAQILPTTGEVGSTVASTTTSSPFASAGGSSASTSVNSSAFFDRQATVGLSGNWGVVDFGRQNNVAYDKLVEFDPRAYGNFGGMGSMGANKLSRENSAVKYYSPVVNGFQVGALYGFGGVAGSNNAGTTEEAFLGYSNGALKLMSTYSVLHTDVAGAAAAGYDVYYGASTTSAGTVANNPAGAASIQQIAVAGQYTAGQITGILGYLNRWNAAATSSSAINPQGHVTQTWGGAKYQVNPTNIVTFAYYTVNDPTVGTISSYSNTSTTGTSAITSGLGSQNYHMFALDYQYSLSKRTTLYGIAALMVNDTGSYKSVADNGKVSANNATNGLMPNYGQNQTGFTVGVKHNF